MTTLKYSHFTTDAYPGDRRVDAWRDALGHVSLGLQDTAKLGNFYGQARSVVSPLGIHFTRLAASGQSLTGLAPRRTRRLDRLAACRRREARQRRRSRRDRCRRPRLWATLRRLRPFLRRRLSRPFHPAAAARAAVARPRLPGEPSWLPAPRAWHQPDP